VEIDPRTIQTIASRAVPSTLSRPIVTGYTCYYTTNRYLLLKKKLLRGPSLILFVDLQCISIFLVAAFLFLQSSFLLWVSKGITKIIIYPLLAFRLLDMFLVLMQMKCTLRLTHLIKQDGRYAAFIVSRRFNN
jgi:hypothetical protein